METKTIEKNLKAFSEKENDSKEQGEFDLGCVLIGKKKERYNDVSSFV